MRPQLSQPSSCRHQRALGRNTGFTLIELVSVILVLGILSAVAVPKFIDMASDATKGNLSGTYGGFRSAVEMAHQQWYAKGKPSTITLKDGQVITMSTAGYPQPLGGNPGCINLMEGLLSASPELASWPTTVPGNGFLVFGNTSLCYFIERSEYIRNNTFRYFGYFPANGTFFVWNP